MELIVSMFLAGAFFVYVFGSGPGFWVGVAAIALSGVRLVGFVRFVVQDYRERLAELETKETDLKGSQSPDQNGGK